MKEQRDRNRNREKKDGEGRRDVDGERVNETKEHRRRSNMNVCLCSSSSERCSGWVDPLVQRSVSFLWCSLYDPFCVIGFIYIPKGPGTLRRFPLRLLERIPLSTYFPSMNPQSMIFWSKIRLIPPGVAYTLWMLIRHETMTEELQVI